jgi:WD40 repeat protein
LYYLEFTVNKILIFWKITAFFNLRRFVRNQVLFENTLFQCVAYHPEEYHIITGGSDRKIAYWEAANGAQIRELEASKSGTINGLDIDSAGNYFVTVSADKLVKVRKYSFFTLIKNNEFSYGVIMKVTYLVLVLVMVVK